MGASQSQPTMQELSKYKIIQKFPQTNITYLSHNQTGDEYLLRESTFNQQDEYKKNLNVHNKREEIKEEHLTHLIKVENRKIDQLCSNLYKIYALWEFPNHFLSQQIAERIQQNRRFEDQEIWSILISSIQALNTLQRNKIKHEMITTKTILLDSEGLIKIADPLAIGAVSNIDVVNRNRNAEGIYLSPQQIELLQSRGINSNPYKNDVWAIGMILLECGLLKSQSNCYKDEYQRIDYSLIEKNIDQFGKKYGEQLKSVIALMLKNNNRDRPDWIDLCQYVKKMNQRTNCNNTVGQQLQAQNNFYITHNQTIPPFLPYSIPSIRPGSNTPAQYIILPKTSFQLPRDPIQNIRPQSWSIPIGAQTIKYAYMPTAVNKYTSSLPPSYLPFNNQDIPGNYLHPANSTTSNNNYIQNTYQINSSIPFSNFHNRKPNNLYQTPLQSEIIPNQPLLFSDQLPSFPPKRSKYQVWKSTQLFKNDLNKTGQTIQQPRKNLINNVQFTTTLPSTNYANLLSNPTPNFNDHNTTNFRLSNHSQPLQKPQNYAPQTITTLFNKQQPLNTIETSYFNETFKTKTNNTQPNIQSQPIKTTESVWKNYEAITGKKEELQETPINYVRGPSESYNNSNLIDNQLLRFENSLEPNEKPQFVVQTFRQGSKYEGLKLNEMRHGKGKFYYQDGGMYDGNWHKNKMDGYGTLYYQSGQLAYQGMWKEDKFQGKGKLFNESPYPLQGDFNFRNFDEIDDFWQYYEGDFVQDFKKGQGKFMLSNGEYFEGTFDNDMVEGPGVFYCKNGNIIRGFWRHNQLIQD